MPEPCDTPTVMEEDEFWRIIALAGASADDEDLHRISLHLRSLDADRILGFQDRLAEVLFRMDLHEVAKQKWRDVSELPWLPRTPGISADGFLYARCSAVLEGPQMVAAIVAEPRTFRRRWDVDAEGLLNVGVDAWEAATGLPYDYDREAPYSYETGSNPAGGWA